LTRKTRKQTEKNGFAERSKILAGVDLNSNFVEY